MSRPLHEQGLRAWMELILQPLGYDPIIYSNQGKPRPIPPYADLLILSDARTGQPEDRSFYDGGEDVLHDVLKGRRQGTCTISIYGGSYDEAAQELEISHRRQAVKDLLHQYGVTLGQSLGIQRLSIDTDGVIEARAILDYTFRWAHISDQETDDWIEQAIITRE